MTTFPVHRLPFPSLPPWPRPFGPVLAALLLAGCAGYAPRPLDDRPDLRADLSDLVVPAAAMPLPELREHTVDWRRPLDMDAVAMIAVARNPDLRTARAQAHITRAQAFAAGLLPDPQVTGELGFLTSGPAPMNSIAFGLMQDVMPLITLSSRRTAAAASVRGADLALLWQEWQVVSQARLLVARLDALERQRALLEANRALFADRHARTSAAMARGDQGQAAVVSDLAALNAVETQLDDVDQQILRNRLDLNALLGLEAGARLPLAPLPEDVDAAVPVPDDARIQAELPALVSRRPDLLALKAAYAVQEEALWQAVVAQFPGLSIGSNRASDTSNVKTQSIAVSMGLPLFNRNQGGVAVEKATRESLRVDYRARLDAAYGGVAQALAVIRQARARYAALRTGIAALEAAAADAEAAWRGGGLDERAYADLQGALLARRGDALRLRQIITEQRVVLLTLIGSAVPAAPGPSPDIADTSRPEEDPS